MASDKHRGEQPSLAAPSANGGVTPFRNGHQAISLFSGAGGIDLGLRHVGFKVVACLELERYACETLRINNPDATVVGPPHYSGDITQISPQQFMSITGIAPGECAVVAGGPPCQPFSIAANQRYRKADDRFKRIGFEDKDRGDLIAHFVDYVLALRPQVFLLENVPGLQELAQGVPLQRQLERLRQGGFALSAPTILNAAHFGVPQGRERLFVVGVQGTRTVPQIPTTGELLDAQFAHRHVVAHALTGLPQGLANHSTRDHRATSVERYKRLAFGKREPLGRVDRLDPLKPAKTVISGGTKGGGRSHLHPYLARTLSPRECARLQTFPDDYVFMGTIGRQFTQVGNAVPPLLAAALGFYMARSLLGVRDLPTTSVAPYLDREERLEELCRMLHQESLRQDRELLYFDSLENAFTNALVRQQTLDIISAVVE